MGIINMYKTFVKSALVSTALAYGDYSSYYDLDLDAIEASVKARVTADL